MPCTIVLKGAPISTQHIYGARRYGQRHLTSEARSLKEDYAWQAKAQWRKEPVLLHLAADVKLYFKDHRRRDWDNWHKLSFDALEKIVYKDDSQIMKASVEKFIDKKKPRIEITLSQL